MPPTHALSPTPPALQRRLPALTLAAGSLALLLVAATLSPARAGVGTHQSLGLPPCGFLLTTGLPCVTCGMTTSFAHATRGDLVTAFHVQPAGTVLAVLAAMALLVTGWASVTGASLAPLARVIWRPALIWFAGGAVLAAWLYKLAVFHGGGA